MGLPTVRRDNSHFQAGFISYFQHLNCSSIPQLLVGGAAEIPLSQMSNRCQRFVRLFSGCQMLFAVSRKISWPSVPLPMTHPTWPCRNTNVEVKKSRVSISDHLRVTDGEVSWLFCSLQVTEATALRPELFQSKNYILFIRNMWNVWFILHQGNISAGQWISVRKIPLLRCGLKNDIWHLKIWVYIYSNLHLGEKKPV